MTTTASESNRQCARCGEMLRDDEEFCSLCGSKPPVSGQPGVSKEPSTRSGTVATDSATHPIAPVFDSQPADDLGRDCSRPRPGAVRFKRRKPEEIAKHVEYVLEQQMAANFQPTQVPLGCGGVLLTIVFFAVGLWPVALIFLLLDIYLLVSPRTTTFRFNRKDPDVQARLTGMRHEWRNCISGDCPVCHREFWFSPPQPTGQTWCPFCNVVLKYESDLIWPANDYELTPKPAGTDEPRKPEATFASEVAARDRKNPPKALEMPSAEMAKLKPSLSPRVRACPECGNMISKDAQKCIYCGAVFVTSEEKDEPRFTIGEMPLQKFGFIAGLVVLIVGCGWYAVSRAVGSRESVAATSSRSDTPNAAATSTPAPGPADPRIAQLTASVQEIESEVGKRDDKCQKIQSTIRECDKAARAEKKLADQYSDFYLDANTAQQHLAAQQKWLNESIRLGDELVAEQKAMIQMLARRDQLCYELGYVLFQSGKKDEARTQFQKVAQSQGTNELGRAASVALNGGTPPEIRFGSVETNAGSGNQGTYLGGQAASAEAAATSVSELDSDLVRFAGIPRHDRQKAIDTYKVKGFVRQEPDPFGAIVNEDWWSTLTPAEQKQFAVFCAIDRSGLAVDDLLRLAPKVVEGYPVVVVPRNSTSDTNITSKYQLRYGTGRNIELVPVNLQ